MNADDASQDSSPRPLWRSVVVHTAFVLISALLLSLGLWQLNRAEEKRALLASEAFAAAAPAVGLDSVLADVGLAAKRYTRVTITGVWMPQNQLLWDNRIADGQAGYEVITPFKTESGTVVLVNRGWVPVGPSRALLPEVSLPGAEASFTLQGVVTRPSKGLASGPAVETSGVWPKRVQFMDYAAFASALQLDLVPALIQARLKDEPVRESWQLLGNWEPTESFGPSRHLGYAVQWFALLLTLIFLYVWYELRWFRAAKNG